MLRRMTPMATTLSALKTGNTTLNPKSDDGAGMFDTLLWIPYLVLITVLVIITGVSFWRYHRRNRGKYKDQNTQSALPRETKKYRVTLSACGQPPGTCTGNRDTLYIYPGLTQNSRTTFSTVEPISKENGGVISSPQYVTSRSSPDLFLSKDRTTSDIAHPQGHTTTFNGHHGSQHNGRYRNYYVNEAYDGNGETLLSDHRKSLSPERESTQSNSLRLREFGDHEKPSHHHSYTGRGSPSPDLELPDLPDNSHNAQQRLAIKHTGHNDLGSSSSSRTAHPTSHAVIPPLTDHSSHRQIAKNGDRSLLPDIESTA